MQNIKAFKWGNTTSLLFAALFIIYLEVAIGTKSAVVSNNLEKEKSFVQPIKPMPTAVLKKGIPPTSSKIQQRPSQPVVLKPTPSDKKHRPSARTSNKSASKPTSVLKTNNTSLKDPHPSPPLSSSNNLLQPKQPNKKAYTTITLHPYSKTQPAYHKLKFLPHKVKSHNNNNTSQPNTLPEMGMSSSVSKKSQFINSTKLGHKATPNPSTPSPDTHVSKLKSTSPSRPQTQVNKVPSPVLKVAKFFNTTDQPGHRSYHPSQVSPKLKASSPLQSQTLQVSKVSSPLSTDNQLANPTESGSKPGHHQSNRSQVSQNSKLKPVPTSQTQTLQVSVTSSPILTNNQSTNSTQSGSKPGHHPSFRSRVFENSKLKSAPASQTQTLQVSVTSSPILTNNQSTNSTQSGSKPGHHPSTRSRVFENSKLKSAPASQTQTLQVSVVTSSPIPTNNQPNKSMESGSKPAHHPFTRSRVFENSKLKSAPASQTRTLQVSVTSSPLPTDNQPTKSTESGSKPGHHPSTRSRVSENSKLKSAPASQTQTQVSVVKSGPKPTDKQPINSTEVRDKAAPTTSTTNPDFHVPQLKSISLSKPQASQVNEVTSPSPVLTDNQLARITEPGNRLAHLSTPSQVSNNSKLKPTPSSQPQTLQVSKVPSPILADNQLVNSAQSGDKLAPHSSSPSPISENAKLKSGPTPSPHTSKVGNVSSPAVLKDNQPTNLTDTGDKRFHHPSTPSPVFHNSKLKSTSPPGPQTLQVGRALTFELTDNQFVNSTESPDKLAHHTSTPSQVSHVSELKSASLSRQQISNINEVSSPLLQDAQLLNSTKSENKPLHHSYNAQLSHKSKLKSHRHTASSRTKTSQFSNVSSPLLAENQLVNPPESGSKSGHHPSTLSRVSENSKLKSAPASQTQPLQVSVTSSPLSTDNQFVNSTVSGNQQGHHPHIPSPVSQNSNLKPAHQSQPQTFQVKKVSSPVSTDNQLVNSAESGDKSGHHPSPVTRNALTTSAPPSQTQTSQVNKMSSPVSKVTQLFNKTDKPGHRPHHTNPVSYNSHLKSPPPSQTQTSQVSNTSSSLSTDNQLVNPTESGVKVVIHTSTPSPAFSNSKLKSAPPSRPQALQVSKVPSPVSPHNQLVTLKEPEDELAHHQSTPSPVVHNSKLKVRPQLSLVNKVASPIPPVKDIKFVTSTESGDKTAHFKLTFR